MSLKNIFLICLTFLNRISLKLLNLKVHKSGSVFPDITRSSDAYLLLELTYFALISLRFVKILFRPSTVYNSHYNFENCQFPYLHIFYLSTEVRYLVNSVQQTVICKGIKYLRI